MFVVATITLFVVYSLKFYHNPEFSSNETVNYIDFSDGHDSYILNTNRTTLAVSFYADRYPRTSKYLRVRFA